MDGTGSGASPFPDDDSPRLTGIWYFILILFALLQLFFFLFCLFMVIYLSIRLKKRAWDSPAKRFSNILNVFISLTFLAFVIYNVCIVSRRDLVILIVFIFTTSTSLSHLSFLYLTTICVSLLLQILSPFLHEKVKQFIHKTRCAIFTEVVCHMLLPAIFIVLTTYTTADVIENSSLNIELGIFLILIVLFFPSLLIFAFGVVLMKFFRNQNIALSIIYMIIKLIFILLIYITFNIASIIIAINLEFIDLWLLIICFNVMMVLYFILSIIVVSLNYPIWCCKCCCRRSPDRTPLLPVNDTEGQQTNPASVLDHRNVPSSTAANFPYEMSDCRSDYEQLAWHI